MTTRSLLLTVLALGLAGCDFLDRGQNHAPMTATGRVVLAGTDEPLEGFGVAIVGVVGGVPRPLDQTETDADGRFALRYDPPKPAEATFAIGYFVSGNYPYDPAYTLGLNRGINPGDHVDAGTVEVARTVTP